MLPFRWTELNSFLQAAAGADRLFAQYVSHSYEVQCVSLEFQRHACMWSSRSSGEAQDIFTSDSASIGVLVTKLLGNDAWIVLSEIHDHNILWSWTFVYVSHGIECLKSKVYETNDRGASCAMSRNVDEECKAEKSQRDRKQGSTVLEGRQTNSCILIVQMNMQRIIQELFLCVFNVSNCVSHQRAKGASA